MDRLPIPSFITAALKTANGGTEKRKDPPPNPLSYPKSSDGFSSELFQNPTSEYRGMPFWAWNTKLNREQLLRQVDIFAEMGMGGFHMHARTGLDTEYLGTEFLEMVSACVDAAEKKKLFACLYDEDRWPSGTAGGKVIKDNPDFKQKKMKFSPNFYDGDLLAAYIVELDENGCLKSYRVLKEVDLNEHVADTNIWFAYMETNGPDAWFNGETYVDTLSKEAMAHFIDLTHETYKAKLGHKFGTTIPCIFTDEPEFTIMNQLDNPHARNDVFFAWSVDFLKTYEKEYKSDLLQYLPELVWNLADGKPSAARVRYRDHSCERFVSAFMDQIAAWCGKNNLFLNGHMMEEPTLHSQTCALGEAMRCYRSMQMPGMDLLCDWVEYNTAKQVSSVARQNGLRGAMSELYGVTHWDYTFEGHKGQGDWQAALGITMRVHHLTWVSMVGEGKRDYPASIGYQSPWYKEYGYVESHFARVGVALTRGKALTRVGIVHPVESYWLSFGPNGNGDEKGIRDQAFGDLTNWLLHGLIDFDFISESLLPNQIQKGPKGKLSVGACEYDVIILPNLKTIRSTTLKILRLFSKAGGKVIIAGSAPAFVDAAIPSANPTIETSRSILFSQQSIVSSLEEYRDLRIVIHDNVPEDKFLYQMRKDGEERFVFICNRDRNSPITTTVKLRGAWEVEKLDTLSGVQSEIKAYVKKGWTSFPYRFEGCASLLLRLSPPSSSLEENSGISSISGEGHIIATDVKLKSVELSEPNVLLLDYAEFRINDESWSAQEEVLRIDNIIRRKLGLFAKGDRIKQPWVFSPKEREPKARATLRFTVNSEFTFSEPCKLALEDSDKIMILVNDIVIPVTKPTENHENWWVDTDIKTVDIPPYLIHKGKNTVTLSFDFSALTNVERIYLLGNFSVHLDGWKSTVRPLGVNPITWGNVVPQGFPFYVGNIIYKVSITVPPTKASTRSNILLSVPNFSNPVLAVTDTKTEKKLGRIAFQPHTLDLGKPKEGIHELEITAFGNRYNSFSHIHVPEWIGMCGPGAWRSGGDWWTNDYTLKPLGILDAPKLVVEIFQVEDDDEHRSREHSLDWVKVCAPGI